MPALSVPSFGGGVVLFGSSDAQRTDELELADSYDIGPRGQLIAASDLSDLTDSAAAAIDAQDAGVGRLSEIWGVTHWAVPGVVGGVASGGNRIVVVGTGPNAKYSIFHRPFLNGVGTIIRADIAAGAPFASPAALLAGRVSVTFASLPAIDTFLAVQSFPMFVNMGARRGTAAKSNNVPGLYVLRPTSIDAVPQPIGQFDSLGTGALSAGHPAGTLGKQLYFRGIGTYNSHLLGWGFDNSDGSGEGPNRVMFSNLGLPQKWGNDLVGGAADRNFTDSDAFLVGGMGTVIRAGVTWAGKFWFGTNVGLYYLEGFGRESFITNGGLPVRKSWNVVGPHALIEGPDGLLHGVGDDGHFIFDGGATDPIGMRLRKFDGKSTGYWDLIWSDATRADGYPGATNQDLVWMLSLPESKQVWIVIPFCDATTGYGPGSDTVILKYHTITGGYTRQVFAGMILSAGSIVPRDVDRVASTVVARIKAASVNLEQYGYRASGASSPVISTTFPSMRTGEYAPHGVDGTGVNRKVYITLSWESGASLPLVFAITPYVDGKAATAVTLTVKPAAPGAPAHGDLWVDTSGTDANLGNGTAGTIIPASAADFLLRRWHSTWAKWVYVPGMGQQGTRITVPIAYVAQRGTRVKFLVAVSSSLTGRYQIEGLGFDPTAIRSDA